MDMYILLRVSLLNYIRSPFGTVRYDSTYIGLGNHVAAPGERLPEFQGSDLPVGGVRIRCEQPRT
jgi:hypothetical protein